MSNVQINVTDELVNQIIVTELSVEPNRVVVSDDAIVNQVFISEEQANVIRVLTSGGQGIPGTQILKDDTPPSNSAGRIGDYFLDTASRFLYGPKTAAGWDLDDYIILGVEVSLGEVTDVVLTSTQDKEVLMYDADTNTWKNQRIRYRHDQAVPSDEWTIDHGLNTKPAAISVFDTSNTHVFGDVEYESDGRVVLRFSAPFAGVAYLT